MIPVVGNLIKCGLGHQRSPCADISPVIFFEIFDPSLHLLYDLCTLRHKEWKSLADDIYRCENIHIASETVVVAVLNICKVSQILFELILLCICRAIDTCEHLVMLITSPVSS